VSTAVISVQGVLRKQVGGYIIPEGVRLYHALCRAGNVLLLHDGNSDRLGRNAIEDWLMLEGLINHDDMQIYFGEFSTRVSLIRSKQKYNVDMVVVSEPDEASKLITAGFNTLLFTHASFARPEWRPDAPVAVKPWDELSKQVADAARAKALDPRLRGRDD
jgi:hypothetical protein